MQLPNVNKNGKPYLSWSEIELFYKDSFEWWSRYVIKSEFIPNKYTDFGKKVGKGLELGDFNEFSPVEQMILKKVERLPLMEERVILDLGEFEVVGYVDSASQYFRKIIDYKTGGADKFKKYAEPTYLQMQIYSCAIRQMYGNAPEQAEVHYITREGRNELKVAYKSPIVLQMDIREEVLDATEMMLKRAFTDISNYYLSRIN